MIRVLIVEDSQVARDFLSFILESDSGIEIVGTATNGVEALEVVPVKRPDLITMDINMPRMNGLEATRRIMETYPTPIIIVSGSNDSAELTTTFSAVEAGALAVVPRPVGVAHPDFQSQANELVRLVKAMAEVKVVRRHKRFRDQPSTGAEQAEPSVAIRAEMSEIGVVAVGASTGGPMALRELLAALPSDFSIPIVIVQHMAKGFIEGFSDWLGKATGRKITVPGHLSRMEPGGTYVAPDDKHLSITKGARFFLSDEPPVNGLRPSVTVLFRSVADAYGSSSIGILLTGMGQDGAIGLKQMKDCGAITFAQDEASSVVYGMPGEAKKLGAAGYILSPQEIASALAQRARR